MKCAICKSNIETNVSSFMFKHYLKHLRRDINSTAIGLGISNPYFENRYSLINEIIKMSKNGENVLNE